MAHRSIYGEARRRRVRPAEVRGKANAVVTSPNRNGPVIAQAVDGHRRAALHVAAWVEFKPGKGFTPSVGSYDAIRVYLWAGLLAPATPQREAMLKALSGMARYLHTNAVPPSKVKPDGSVEDPKSPVGFSAALLPYLSALGEKNLEDEQMSRVRSELNSQTGLYSNPAKYYDQNLILFALGATQQESWFDAQGNLKLRWKHD